MSDSKATFAIELKDDVSSGAITAADALRKLKGAIDRETQALGQMNRALKAMKVGGQEGSDAFKELQGKIESSKKSIAQNTAVYTELGGAFGKVRKEAKKAGDGADGFLERMKKIPGPIGDIARKFGDLKGVFGGVRLAGLAAMGVFAALGVGLLVGLGKLFAFAARSPEAIRSAATRAGGPVMSLSRQMTVMKRDFGRLFSGLNVGPFLRGMQTITGMFSQNTATGRALKAIVEVMFQPMFDSVGHGAPMIKRFFQGLIIGILQVAIYVLQLRNKFRETFGNVDLFHGLSALDVGIGLAKVALGGILITAGIVVGAFVLLGVAMYSVYRAGVLIFDMFGALYEALNEAGALLLEFENKLIDIGSQMMRGLADGIRNGSPMVITAITALAGPMAGALRAALDIHSPSRVFARIGVQIPRGIESGIESGSQSLNRTVADIVSTPTDVGQVRESARAPSGGSSMSFSFGDVYVSGSDSPREAARSFIDEVSTMLEGVGISMGVPAT